MSPPERAHRPGRPSPTPVSDPERAIGIDEFRKLFRRHPGAVALVTAHDGSTPAAMTVTSVTSVSADPPILMFSVTDISTSAPTVLAAGSLVAHLLTTADVDLAVLGATSGVDRFADRTAWTRLKSGEPVFRQVGTWVRGEIVFTHDLGRSTLVGVQATDFKVAHDPAPPLIYHDQRWYGLQANCQIPYEHSDPPVHRATSQSRTSPR